MKTSLTWSHTRKSTVTPRGNRKSRSSNCKALRKRKRKMNSTRLRSSCKMNATWSTPTNSSPVKALTSTGRSATLTTSTMTQWLRGTSSNCCATRMIIRRNNLSWGRAIQMQTLRRTVRSSVSRWRSCMTSTSMTKPTQMHLRSWRNPKKTRLRPASTRSSKSCCSSWTTTTSTSSPKCQSSTTTASQTSSPCRQSKKTPRKQSSTTSTSASWQKRTTTPSSSGDSTVSTLKMKMKCQTWEQAWTTTKTSMKPSSRNKSKCLKNSMTSKVMKCQLWRLLRVMLMMRLGTRRSLRNNWSCSRVWTTCTSRGVRMSKKCLTWRHQGSMKVQVRMSSWESSSDTSMN